MYYLISIVLGLIPEVLYFTLFLIFVKNIKNKKLLLFILISLIYFLCMLICQYKLIFYAIFIISIYLILKILYKDKIEIIDFFIINFSAFILTIISFFTFLFVKKDLSNYYTMYIINRIILFSIFIFKEKLRNIYLKYYKYWNRNDKENRPIKSITVRNCSIIFINLFIYSINILINNILNLIVRG